MMRLQLHQGQGQVSGVLILQPMNSSSITYDSEQLITAAVWLEVAHGVPFRGRSYRLGARLICLGKETKSGQEKWRSHNGKVICSLDYHTPQKSKTGLNTEGNVTAVQITVSSYLSTAIQEMPHFRRSRQLCFKTGHHTISLGTFG